MYDNTKSTSYSDTSTDLSVDIWKILLFIFNSFKHLTNEETMLNQREDGVKEKSEQAYFARGNDSTFLIENGMAVILTIM